MRGPGQACKDDHGSRNMRAGSPRRRLAETSGENATDEDVVAPEVTEELNRLKTLGRAYQAPSVNELMPLRYVYSQKANERLDDRVVAEGRERELYNVMFTGCAVRDLEGLCVPAPRSFVAGSWQVR